MQEGIIAPDWTFSTILLYVLVALAALGSGWVERRGMMTINYSKFRSGKGISSRTGMFLLYFTPLLVFTPALWVFTHGFSSLSMAQYLLIAAIAFHFCKRCLEVLFIHKYSGPIEIPTVIQIGSAYSLLCAFVAYRVPYSTTSVDKLVLFGIALFMIGQAGNFYHHKLLADLRNTQEGYFIPKGALFELVTCPHYFFEIIAWLGVAFISRHLDMFILTLIMAAYLTGRSVKASAWYKEKFSDYPKARKNIIPFVF